MCLLALAWRSDPRYPLVVAANRDEFYKRPALAADYWPDAPGLLAGRDEEAGGTWLGVQESGRFAAITNARGAASPGSNSPSRGGLVSDFLASESSAADYARACQEKIADYAGCNLLVCDGQQLFYVTNHPEAELRKLPPGRYPLSNGHLDDHWPKMKRLASGLDAVLDQATPDTTALLDLLTDRQQAKGQELPNTGVGKLVEKQLSSVFIHLPVYGTRCSTAILVDAKGHLQFHERRFNSRGRADGDSHYEMDWPAFIS